MSNRCWLLVTAIVLGSLSAVPAAEDPVAQALDEAKWEYLRSLDAAQTEILAWFDRREQGARKHGNKSLVDQIRVQRGTFEARLELPATAPASLRNRQQNAESSMRAAYVLAIKEFTRIGNDPEAAAMERELATFNESHLVRSRWVHPQGEFRQAGREIWTESSPDGNSYSYREIGRNQDYVELRALNGNTATRIRLRDTTADYGYEPKVEYRTEYLGKWVR